MVVVVQNIAGMGGGGEFEWHAGRNYRQIGNLLAPGESGLLSRKVYQRIARHFSKGMTLTVGAVGQKRHNRHHGSGDRPGGPDGREV